MTWWSRRWRRKELEQDLDRELQFHMAERISALERTGLSESEARRQVRQEFGGIEQVKEQCREARGTRWLEDLSQDLRFACRTLRKTPVWTAVVSLTLALGMGAVTTMFSVVDGVLWQPLAYKDPGRLYAAAMSSPQLARAYPRLPVNGAHFRSWQEQCRSCESEALLNPASFNLTGAGEPEQIEGATCTWPLFHVLGVRPQLGRTFVESDDQPGTNRCVVISHSLWQRLGADSAIVGKSIRVDGEPHPVVGVLRADFHLPSGEQLGPLNQFPKRAEIFKPMGFNWAKLGRVGSFNFACLVRLRPGANPAQARSGDERSRGRRSP